MVLILPDPTWDGSAVEAIAAAMDEGKQQPWRQKSALVYFKHRRARFHLDHAIRTVDLMVERMQPLGLNEDNNSIVSSYAGPLIDELYFHLDGFLEAMRSAHDGLMPLLMTAKIVRADAPSSIHDFVRQIRKRSTRAVTDPPEIAGILEIFWRETGETLRDYRNCFTHHVSLSGPTWQATVMMFGRSEGWTPWVPWPDNPHSNSYSKFSFDRKLDAIEYCGVAWNATDTFLRDITQRCRIKWNAVDDISSPHTSTIVMAASRIS